MAVEDLPWVMKADEVLGDRKPTDRHLNSVGRRFVDSLPSWRSQARAG
jgi:hypothetical protein